jgi:hypothetical protein
MDAQTARIEQNMLWPETARLGILAFSATQVLLLCAGRNWEAGRALSILM